MKQIHIYKKPTRLEYIKLFLKENIFTAQKIGFVIASLLSWIFYYFIPIAFALIPIYIHVLLWAISYYQYSIKRKKDETVWDKYVSRYGNKKGEIPADVRMRHKKMISEGKQISL